MAATEREVYQALGRVPYPGFQRDIVSFGIVRAVEIRDERVQVELEIKSAAPAVAAELERAVRAALLGIPGVREVEVRLRGQESPAPQAAAPSAGIADTIAVASGKGGVGKSTVAVNLAVALARRGARVGLLDADVYGPSIPLMTGIHERPRLDPEQRRIEPFERHGVRWMSLGFLVDREAAVIWRGPMVMKAIDQLLHDVNWGELHVLVVDLPPGTGDAQLTLAQRARLSGALIVTTPQDLALADAIKGIAMFRRVGVPVLGLVENMSDFTCPHCGQRSAIFGSGGGRREAARLGVPFLGEIPLDSQLRASGDSGEPLVAASPESAIARAFDELARQVQEQLASARAGTSDTPE